MKQPVTCCNGLVSFAWSGSASRVAVLLVVAMLVLPGCALLVSAPSKDRLAYQVVFTVAERSEVASPFADGAGEEQHTSLVAKILKLHGLKKVAEWPIKALGLSAIVAEVRDRKAMRRVVESLQQDDRIESVSTVKSYETMSYNDTYFRLQDIALVRDFESVHEFSTGKNVTVALVDTGLDRQHPEIAGRVSFARNYVDYDQARFDSDEHGTAVAGVIASAANNAVGIVGVAPDVELKVFKACAQGNNGRATCDSVSLMKALIDVINHQPDILNLSLSGPEDDLIRRLLVRAYTDGIVLVAAVDPRRVEASFPASMPEVISVGTSLMLADTGNLPVSRLASLDWTVLVAGSEVLTTTPGATYGFKSGSSMATAYVSGIVALMLERGPDLSAEGVRRELVESSRTSLRSIPLVDLCGAVSGANNAELCTGLARTSRE